MIFSYVVSVHTPYMYPVDVEILWASSDFDGDFAPEFGTQHSPANYCARYARWSPIVLKIGLKDAAPEAASFEPMYVWFGYHLA